MSDAISPELRAQIDAKVAAGDVTRLPEAGRARSGRKSDEVARRRDEIKKLVGEGKTTPMILAALADMGFHISTATLSADKKILGISKPRASGGHHRTIDQKKAARATRGAEKVADRRRYKSVSVPFGRPSNSVDAEMTGPRFPDRVFIPDGSELVFKDGCNNAKIGGDVLVGWLKGAYIATLTLPERTTCPTSCKMWTGCYGNSMHYSRRWAPGPELEAKIRHEVELMCDKNDLVLIRLHVLGDFYNFDYVALWAELLDEYPNLHAFGFTAWERGTEIGDGIQRLRGAYPRRFMIRHSGVTGTWGSFTLPFPTEAKTIGDAIVCPEQLDAMKGSPDGRHCGNCAACWSTDAPIAFVEH